MTDRTQIALDVQGMTCEGCASHVEKALRGVAGVHDAKVPSWRAARATVLAGADVADDTLTRSVEEAGWLRRLLRRPLRSPACWVDRASSRPSSTVPAATRGS